MHIAFQLTVYKDILKTIWVNVFLLVIKIKNILMEDVNVFMDTIWLIAYAKCVHKEHTIITKI